MSEKTEATAGAEQHQFQAEVERILALVVNSLYTHREVFLRELVSNASDALDHLSFRALTEPELLGDQRTLEIRIAADPDARTLTISDDGVGMTKDELVRNLGTIAHSGTRALAEKLTGDAQRDVSLIGQFGVGFYSAFLVAERVDVTSRAAGSDTAWRWSSAADGRFSVTPAERDARGTDVVLHIRTDSECDDFLRDWTLRDLVRKYSDYVRHPIRLRSKPKDGDATWEQVNAASALWTRPKGEITEEQAHDFYRHLTHDWRAPLAHVHFKVEGLQELTGLLFLPREAPVDLVTRRHGVRLFVRRVFVMDDCEELLPDYLRFVRGVVDSDDLPLNVSREFLQRDRTTTAIRKQVVRHALQLLDDLAAETEPPARTETEDGADDDDTPREPRYVTFWKAHGRTLKEGVHTDPANRERLAQLLRFETSAGPGLASLADYVGRMQEGQEAIYYHAAPSRAAAEGSPHIEALRSRGYEVVYMTDPIDEWVVDGLREFDGKKLVSAAKGALDLPTTDAEKEERKEREESLGGLVGRVKDALGDAVAEVRLSTRLTDSPACLVVSDDALAPHIERLLRAQNAQVPEQRRILELNPKHPVVERLNALSADDARASDVSEWAHLLYDQALVAEGSPPSDPAAFARRITRLLSSALA